MSLLAGAVTVLVVMCAVAPVCRLLWVDRQDERAHRLRMAQARAVKRQP
jgi:hypothetical protein